MLLGLYELFSIINNSKQINCESVDLFGNTNEACYKRKYKREDMDFVTSYFSRGFNVSLLNGIMRDLFELSFNAFDNILHAWLSELPVERETIAFGKKVIAASITADSSEKKRVAAEKAVSDRLDSDTLAVINTMAKVYRETDRMMGLLRFSPNDNGEFIARCEPDHFVLPALSEYFTSRFGETSWSVIDEKRRLCLRRHNREKVKIFILNSEDVMESAANNDEWEELWKHYHNIINNEDRNNPDLQRQLMPQRYWKYLPEK
ncbi:MAG: TIGR03915 family putative DNA repair protein [Treponema sp.]|nr:TIGR03915 family putative DNA repair protein [Treponema sp.]